ncbi:predicted protein [Histoplasma capsulatum G186AR]|uniref:Uncharacterized protein n=1 Tax=Ajellomyces capsulatus (strain G186AR / H82 / ATCC MYA-2454 / RMSCC 2432) TaxID=447093 RepID=C0P1D4_AJECG|nr:uncharacterized protein HCBG_09214 [Histoplasma capsulatum G186AR]EEH02554.1 predicted protein [Histoplasma capsulatum G186AR]
MVSRLLSHKSVTPLVDLCHSATYGARRCTILYLGLLHMRDNFRQTIGQRLADAVVTSGGIKLLESLAGDVLYEQVPVRQREACRTVYEETIHLQDIHNGRIEAAIRRDAQHACGYSMAFLFFLNPIAETNQVGLGGTSNNPARDK